MENIEDIIPKGYPPKESKNHRFFTIPALLTLNPEVPPFTPSWKSYQITEKKPELLGLAIDENTAILVSGNTFEVLGKSYVLIYDGTYWDQYSNDYLPLQKGEQKFHMLRVGRKYDMKERKVLNN